MMWPFAKPKPTPPGVIIRNRLGEEIDCIGGVYHLEHLDLRGKQWQHADLSDLSLDGANLEGACLFGAKLIRTSFRGANLCNADLSFPNAEGANFCQADLRGASLYRAETYRVQFRDVLLDERSDVPGIKIVMV